MPGQFETGEHYGVVFEKGNPLREDVNKAIAALKSRRQDRGTAGEVVPGHRDLPVFE